MTVTIEQLLTDFAEELHQGSSRYPRFIKIARE
jgi:hypothetical protein